MMRKENKNEGSQRGQRGLDNDASKQTRTGKGRGEEGERRTTRAECPGKISGAKVQGVVTAYVEDSE